jgi:unsaturated chondroitin disaccharide hydrolase
MLTIDEQLHPAEMLGPIAAMWEHSADAIRSIEASRQPGSASPVYTVEGKYTARGWTDWTQGFSFGSAILQFDATGDEEFLALGRSATVEHMAPHVTHFGVHDHGFNNVSTYGNLLRLVREGRIEADDWQERFYTMALIASGAVQANRWARTDDGGGYIYSFNGPQSLFVDTIRSCRSLCVAHQLGGRLTGEQDQPVSLLGRAIDHGRATAQYNIYYGQGRDGYDIPGRVAHESLFNTLTGGYRAPSTQQGYSPFSTWTRGLAWAMVGYAEQLEFLATRSDAELDPFGGRADIEGSFTRAAEATCDFYIAHSPTDGVPYWDTGAPGLARLGDWAERPAEPFNAFEPVDSSAAAIACQGLIRLGRVRERPRYVQAGLTVLRTLLAEPYLSTDPAHQGLILHSVYHQPRRWDHVPSGQAVPCGESCMWGDYHAREAALLVQRLARDEEYLTFFGPIGRENAS